MKVTAFIEKFWGFLNSTANELECELDPSMDYCESCQRAKPKGDKCKRCGNGESLIFCSHCHTANENTRSNCGVCGWDLNIRK